MQETYQSIISQKEIDQIIKIAESENKIADFSNMTIQEINLSEREIRCGLNFTNVVFLGSVYMGQSIIYGDIILNGSVINNTTYLGEIIVKGDFMASRIVIKNSFNMVKGEVHGQLIMEKAHIQGFLGLNKTTIKNNVNLKGLKIIGMVTPSGIINGDLYLQGAELQKSLNMEDCHITGLVDLSKVNIWESLNLTNGEIREALILKESYIKGESTFEGLKCSEKFVSFF